MIRISHIRLTRHVFFLLFNLQPVLTFLIYIQQLGGGIIK